MNFEFSAEQKQLGEEARRFLTAKCPPAALRAILEGPEPFDRALWKGLAEMGIDYHPINTKTPYDQALSAYLNRRAKNRR